MNADAQTSAGWNVFTLMLKATEKKKKNSVFFPLKMNTTKIVCILFVISFEKQCFAALGTNLKYIHTYFCLKQ